MWGIVEVSADTIVVCTMTGLVVLSAGGWNCGESGAALTSLAFGTATGNQALGTIFVTIIVAFFGFATALVNIYYGKICLSALNLKMLIPFLTGCWAAHLRLSVPLVL